MLDVLPEDGGRDREEEQLWEWAGEGWQSWQHSHEWVKTTVGHLLPLSPL